jgi:hypothetical protein
MPNTIEQRRLPRQGRKWSVPILWGVPLWLCGLLSLALLLLCCCVYFSFNLGYSLTVDCEYLTRNGTHVARVSNFAGRLMSKQRQTLPWTKSVADKPQSQGSVFYSNYRLSGSMAPAASLPNIQTEISCAIRWGVCVDAGEIVPVFPPRTGLGFSPSGISLLSHRAAGNWQLVFYVVSPTPQLIQ